MVATVENGRQRVSTAESAEHLTSLLRGIRAAGWTALVIGPPPIADRAHNVRTATLAEHLATVAAKENAPYVGRLPVLLRSPVWMAQVTVGDGAHPAAEGYTALADMLWPRWAAWLAVPATS